MRTAVLALSLAVLAHTAMADDTTGTILAFDRAADVIVMADRTVWELGPKTLIPADLVAGDVVKITFTSAGDSGVGTIQSLEKIEE